MKKLFWGLPIIVIVIAVALFTVNGDKTSGSRYNLNPDLSKKVVVSEVTDGIHFDKPNWKSINELMYYTDLIVIGEPLPDVETKFWEDQLTKSKGIEFKEYYTEYSFKIDKTILGDVNGIVKFSQLGKPGMDECETKIKPGNKYLIFMQKNENVPYHSTCLEEGIFHISKSNKLLSFSKNITFAKYDNIDLKVLIEDIINNSKDFHTKR